MPATPKPPGQRRRTNAEQPQWQSLPAAGREGAVPELPAKDPDWLETTVQWWVSIWGSPMAAAWLDSDVRTLERLARLVDTATRNPEMSTIQSEIRQLEDRFGLSPLARRRLQWEIEQGEEPAAAAPSSGRGDERRARLRAVG